MTGTPASARGFKKVGHIVTVPFPPGVLLILTDFFGEEAKFKLPMTKRVRRGGSRPFDFLSLSAPQLWGRVPKIEKSRG